VTAKINIENDKIVIDGDSNSIDIGMGSTTQVDIGSNIILNGISFATIEDMDIYVRAADGSDSNPGTSSEPLATLVEAEARIPINVLHTIKIHVGPHTGNGYTVPSFRKRYLEANIYIIGNGGGGGTDGFTEIISSTAAGSGSNNELIVTSGLSTSEYGGFGELWGATIEILTGAAAGDRRTIRNNTATGIYPNSQFTATVSSGDLYRVVKPETTIYYNTVDYNTIISNGCGSQLNVRSTHTIVPKLWLINFRLTKGTSQGYWDFVSNNSSIVLMGVISTEEIQFKLGNCSLYGGMERYQQTPDDIIVDSVVSDLSVPNNKSWVGWGLTVESQTPNQATIYVRGSDDSIVSGSFNAEQFAAVNGLSNVYFGSCWGGIYAISQVSRGAKLYIYPIDMDIVWGALTVSGIGIENSGNLDILARGGTNRRFFIYSSGNTISCNDTGLAILISFSSGINIQSNSGIGLLTIGGGKIISVGENPIITASSGDFSQDNGVTTHNISELIANSVFSSSVHGSIRKA